MALSTQISYLELRSKNYQVTANKQYSDIKMQKYQNLSSRPGPMQRWLWLTSIHGQVFEANCLAILLTNQIYNNQDKHQTSGRSHTVKCASLTRELYTMSVTTIAFCIQHQKITLSTTCKTRGNALKCGRIRRDVQIPG